MKNINFYNRLLEIQDLDDEHIDEYKDLFSKMYENRDENTFRQFCTIILDENNFGNGTIVDQVATEYIENYYEIEDINIYSYNLLNNIDAFYPKAQENAKIFIYRIFNYYSNLSNLNEIKRILVELKGVNMKNYLFLKDIISSIKKENDLNKNEEYFLIWVDEIYNFLLQDAK
jgi:hypothetical protein